VKAGKGKKKEKLRLSSPGFLLIGRGGRGNARLLLHEFIHQQEEGEGGRNIGANFRTRPSQLIMTILRQKGKSTKEESWNRSVLSTPAGNYRKGVAGDGA